MKTKLKHKLKNKTKAICQLGNKAMTARQTNKHGEKKRKTRKEKIIEKQSQIEVDKGDLHILKDNYNRKRIRKIN